MGALMVVGEAWVLLQGTVLRDNRKPSQSPACTQLSATECVGQQGMCLDALCTVGTHKDTRTAGCGDSAIGLPGGQAMKETSDFSVILFVLREDSTLLALSTQGGGYGVPFNFRADPSNLPLLTLA